MATSILGALAAALLQKSEDLGGLACLPSRGQDLSVHSSILWRLVIRGVRLFAQAFRFVEPIYKKVAQTGKALAEGVHPVELEQAFDKAGGLISIQENC